MSAFQPIPADEARYRLFQLVDNLFQWWLRLPIVNLLWRHDYVRFVVSLDFIIHQLQEAILDLNCFIDRDGQCHNFVANDPLSGLKEKPKHLVERIERICSLTDLEGSEREARQLLKETISLGCERFGLDFVWLDKVQEPCRLNGGRLCPNPGYHLSLARKLATSYRTLDTTVAIGVGGSVGEGLADETSDLDLDIICDSIPDERIRRDLVTDLADDALDIRLRSDQNSYGDEFFVGGVLIDARYWLLPRWLELIDCPQLGSYWNEETLAHLNSMMTLWDSDSVIATHQTHLREATALVRERRISESFARLSVELSHLKGLALRESAQRVFFVAFTNCILSFFDALSALNDKWIVFPKWGRQWVESLSFKIQDFYPQLQNVVLEKLPRNERGDIISIITALFEELKELCHRTYGNIIMR